MFLRNILFHSEILHTPFFKRRVNVRYTHKKLQTIALLFTLTLFIPGTEKVVQGKVLEAFLCPFQMYKRHLIYPLLSIQVTPEAHVRLH
jgi:hypothetical protein